MHVFLQRQDFRQSLEATDADLFAKAGFPSFLLSLLYKTWSHGFLGLSNLIVEQNFLRLRGIIKWTRDRSTQNAVQSDQCNDAVFESSFETVKVLGNGNHFDITEVHFDCRTVLGSIKILS